MSNPLRRLLLVRSAVCLRCTAAFAGMTQTGRGAVAPAFGELPAVDDRWVHFVAPNFELFSHQGEADSRAILYDL